MGATEFAGYEGELLYSAAGSSYTLVGNLRNVTVSVKKETMDASTHDTAPWKRKISGLKEWSGSAEMVLCGSDVTQTTLYDVLDGEVAGYFKFYPKDYVGAKEYYGLAHVTSWEVNAPNDDVQTLAIEFEGQEELTDGSHT